MENSNNTYKCERCGNTLLKSNKLLHDLKCTSFNNNLNLFQNKYQINKNFIDINEIDSFICEKCGAYINLKDKADHILSHQLEEENKNMENNNNLNNLDILSSSSINNEINQEIENNLNINIIRGDDENMINQQIDVERNFNFLGEEDRLEIDNNILNENLEIENNEEELFSFYIDDFFFFYYENGIDENKINKIPISKIKDINKLTEDKKKCCICLENFKINDETMILPCIHIFHSNCIKAWMKRQLFCPICKNKII